jgi:hypothetical protein
MGIAERATHNVRTCVMSTLAKRHQLNIHGIAIHSGISEADVDRMTKAMTAEHPPMINRVGASDLFQLSVDGRKAVNVKERPPAPIRSPASSVSPISPGPRGQLVSILKNKPTSKKELCKRTGLKCARSPIADLLPSHCARKKMAALSCTG